MTINEIRSYLTRTTISDRSLTQAFGDQYELLLGELDQTFLQQILHGNRRHSVDASGGSTVTECMCLLSSMS